jgi:hypothetical protein
MQSIGGVARSIIQSVAAALQPCSVSTKLSALLKGASNASDAPPMKKIPNVIHHFWHGGTPALLKHAGNLNKTASLNSNYSVVLHVLPTDKAEVQTLASSLPAIVVKDVTQEKWFRDFKGTERYMQFNAAITGERAHFASAADVIKTEILQRKGGVWNDVDNRPLKSLPEKLKVSKGSMLTAGPVTFTRWSGKLGVHSSTLATHKGNSVLADVNKVSLEKFKEVEGVIYNVHKRTDHPDDHFRMISETAGSAYLSEALFKNDTGFQREVEVLAQRGEKFNDSSVIFDQYFEPVTTTGIDVVDDGQKLALLIAMSDPKHFVM